MAHEIITGIKREDGIHVVWQEGKDTRSTFFPYGELITLQINALDLIEHPGNYLLDDDGRRISMRESIRR
jgi:hypothetical protein